MAGVDESQSEDVREDAKSQKTKTRPTRTWNTGGHEVGTGEPGTDRFRSSLILPNSLSFPGGKVIFLMSLTPFTCFLSVWQVLP